MKKSLLVTSLAMVVGLSSVSLSAEEKIRADKYPKKMSTKEGVTAGAGAIMGGIAGGPLGLFLGTVMGSVLGQELKKADEFEKAKQALYKKQETLEALESDYALLEAKVDSHNGDLLYKELEINDIEFQLLFFTGDDTLDKANMERIQGLAELLKKNPNIKIRLHGHADPRGSDGYNNVLAQHRALNVEKALDFYGVDSERVERYSYGASRSKAIKGDLDAYALERKVSVQLVSTEDNTIAIVE